MDVLYKKRSEKAQGYSATCLAMSTEMSLGFQIYQMAKMLHMSIFVNGSLVNMETWTHCTDERIERFERIEQSLFRRILQAHSKTPIEAIYLELGVVPIRYQLMKRRILYLQDIMNRNETEITRMVVMAQKERCHKGDFYAQVSKDMNEIGISSKEMLESKATLKTHLSKKVDEYAFRELMKKARSHSKVHDEMYTDCNGAAHYNNPRFTPDLTNLLFRFRTRTYMVKNNFRNNYVNTNILCPLCNKHEDNQGHLLTCEKIIEKNSEEVDCKIEDIFSKNQDTLHKVACLLKKLDKIRTDLISPDDSCTLEP